MFERYVAIDNVCAWPNLTRLLDGSMIAVIFNQPTHGRWEGDVECWGSDDEGYTWHKHGTVAPHEPGTNRMNVAAGLAHDGALVVLASGWSERPSVGGSPTPEQEAAKRVLLPWVCRSEDGGVTWTQSETFQPPGDRPVIPFGDIVQVKAGVLGACVYGTGYGFASPDDRVHFGFSHDDGRTWTDWTLISNGQHNETTPLLLDEGKLIAAGRRIDHAGLDLLRSTDGGRTWTTEQRLTLPWQYPAQLLRRRDGHLILSYGVRNPGFWGVAYRLSEDNGRTWSRPGVLVNIAPDSRERVDCGYPSTLELDNATLVTAWYAVRSPSHHRYHMGVVRWRSDA